MLGCDTQQWRAQDLAGVVDHDIDLTESTGRVLNSRAHLVCVTDNRGHGMGSIRIQFEGNRGCAGKLTSQHSHTRAVVQKSPRDGNPNAATRASDERMPARQQLCVCAQKAPIPILTPAYYEQNILSVNFIIPAALAHPLLARRKSLACEHFLSETRP